MSKRLKHSREGELFTANRAGFLRELQLTCADAAALFGQSEGIYQVASEIGPSFPCSVGDTLLSLPALMSPCRSEMRGRRARAYHRYLQAVRDSVVDQVFEAAQLKARAGDWEGWAKLQLWLRGRLGCQLAILEAYGLAYRIGFNLSFERRTAGLRKIIALLER